jgi:hypothetical protein
MTQLSDNPTTKILAFLGSLALGFTAMINMVIAALALFCGQVIDAATEAAADGQVASGATAAKVLGVAFAVLAMLEFSAGELLRRRKRNIMVPIACGATIVAEVGLSVWAGKWNGLDVVMLGCAVFAVWTWSRLPRPEITLGFDDEAGELISTPG